MTPEQAEALRKPFPRDVIGQLPRVWCRACGEAKRSGGTCGQHSKVKCKVCRNNITEAHLHLDYVGHAETTDRFLSVDADWTWEPLAFGANGLPQLDENGGLWIRLTIAGVTRLGYGAADGKKGPDAVKEVIGDALRNAGMRFGVALDLWGAKFKDRDDEAGDAIGHGEDPWESATPAPRPRASGQPNRDEVIEKAHAAITSATTVETLGQIRNLVDKRALDNVLTADDALSLHAAINGREAELTGNHVIPQPIGEKQRAELFVLLTETGRKDRDRQIEFLQKVTGRELKSRNDLTADDADKAIAVLRTQQRAGAVKNGKAGVAA
jgi:hypothetical protein